MHDPLALQESAQGAILCARHGHYILFVRNFLGSRTTTRTSFKVLLDRRLAQGVAEWPYTTLSSSID